MGILEQGIFSAGTANASTENRERRTHEQVMLSASRRSEAEAFSIEMTRALSGRTCGAGSSSKGRGCRRQEKHIACRRHDSELTGEG